MAWTSLSGMPISTTWLGWFLCLRSHFWYHSSFSCGCCWCSWISLIMSGRQSVALDFGYAFFVYHCRACPKRRDVLQSSTILKNVFHLSQAKWQIQTFTNCSIMLNPKMKMNGSVKSPEHLLCLQLHQLQLGDWLPDSKLKGFQNDLRLI